MKHTIVRLGMHAVAIGLATAAACARGTVSTVVDASGQPSTMGSCGRLNDPKATYVTAEECRRAGGVFVPGVRPYDKMFVVSA
jgi:hypothetical protein